MFLKLFEPIFSALSSNVKLTLLAILLVVLIGWGTIGEYRVKQLDERCAEEKKDCYAMVARKDQELEEMRRQMFNVLMNQQRSVAQNDSVIRQEHQSFIRQLNQSK